MFWYKIGINKYTLVLLPAAVVVAAVVVVV